MNPLAETGCCPRFDPEPWDDKEVTWQDRLFVRDRVRSLFHVPLNFGGVMRRNMQAIEAAGAHDPECIVLSDEESPWGSNIFVAVSKEVPGAREERISGTFFTRVFEGPYSKAGKWAKEMMAALDQQGRPLKKLYFWYTTCPKCAKSYGKNYVVLLAEQ